MGFWDFLSGDDNSDAKINSLIGSIHKMSNLADALIPSQQVAINQLIKINNENTERINKIEQHLKEKMENAGKI
jgi:hypothetical protein